MVISGILHIMSAGKRKSSDLDSWLAFVGQFPKKAKRNEKECSICFEIFQKGFQCPNPDCNAWTCYKPCFEDAMKGDFSLGCLSCNTIFDRSIWTELGFPAAFQRDILNEKWGKELFQAQQEHLPNFQEKAKREIDIRTAKQMLTTNQTEVQAMMAQLKELKTKINAKKNGAADIKDHIKVLSSNSIADTRRSKINTQCFKPDCPGYMDDTYFCSLCTGSFCKSCEQPVHTGTDCDAMIKATMEEIAQTTQPCPKCSTPISKINGCHQMWCPVAECRTFFDWKTGRELKNLKFRHNPHYLDFAAQQREDAQTQPENNILPRLDEIWNAHNGYISNLDRFLDSNKCSDADNRLYKKTKAISSFYETVSAMLLYLAVDYNEEAQAEEEKLNIQYLLKSLPSGVEYTKKEYTNDLVRLQKKKICNAARRQIEEGAVHDAARVLKKYAHSTECIFLEFFLDTALIAMQTNKQIDYHSKMYSVLPQNRFLQYYWAMAADLHH